MMRNIWQAICHRVSFREPNTTATAASFTMCSSSCNYLSCRAAWRLFGGWSAEWCWTKKRIVSNTFWFHKWFNCPKNVRLLFAFNENKWFTNDFHFSRSPSPSFFASRSAMMSTATYRHCEHLLYLKALSIYRRSFIHSLHSIPFLFLRSRWIYVGARVCVCCRTLFTLRCCVRHFGCIFVL